MWIAFVAQGLAEADDGRSTDARLLSHLGDRREGGELLVVYDETRYLSLPVGQFGEGAGDLIADCVLRFHLSYCTTKSGELQGPFHQEA